MLSFELLKACSAIELVAALAGIGLDDEELIDAAGRDADADANIVLVAPHRFVKIFHQQVEIIGHAPVLFAEGMLLAQPTPLLPLVVGALNASWEDFPAIFC